MLPGQTNHPPPLEYPATRHPVSVDERSSVARATQTARAAFASGFISPPCSRSDAEQGRKETGEAPEGLLKQALFAGAQAQDSVDGVRGAVARRVEVTDLKFPKQADA